MWNESKQAKAICAYSHSIITIFKPEHKLYSKLHPRAYYFGHPLTELIPDLKNDKASFPKAPHITILPGSRPQEFNLYAKKMLQTLELLFQQIPDLSIELPISAPKYMPIIKANIAKYDHLPIAVTQRPAHEVIAKTSLVLSASGSVTLEAILLKKPLIVLAALPPLTYFLAKYILRLKLKYISLPNVLTQSYLVPEFVQSKMNPNQMAASALEILKNPTKAIQGYDELISCLKHNKKVYTSIVSLILKKD